MGSPAALARIASNRPFGKWPLERVGGSACLAGILFKCLPHGGIPARFVRSGLRNETFVHISEMDLPVYYRYN
jgi:hypothetical protein